MKNKKGYWDSLSSIIITLILLVGFIAVFCSLGMWQINEKSFCEKCANHWIPNYGLYNTKPGVDWGKCDKECVCVEKEEGYYAATLSIKETELIAACDAIGVTCEFDKFNRDTVRLVLSEEVLTEGGEIIFNLQKQREGKCLQAREKTPCEKGDLNYVEEVENYCFHYNGTKCHTHTSDNPTASISVCWGIEPCLNISTITSCRLKTLQDFNCSELKRALFNNRKWDNEATVIIKEGQLMGSWSKGELTLSDVYDTAEQKGCLGDTQ